MKPTLPTLLRLNAGYVDTAGFLALPRQNLGPKLTSLTHV